MPFLAFVQADNTYNSPPFKKCSSYFNCIYFASIAFRLLCRSYQLRFQNVQIFNIFSFPLVSWTCHRFFQRNKIYLKTKKKEEKWKKKRSANQFASSAKKASGSVPQLLHVCMFTSISNLIPSGESDAIVIKGFVRKLPNGFGSPFSNCK